MYDHKIMTELAVVHYRQFRHISQVCRINYHGQSCRMQQTNPEELKNDPLPLTTVVTISLYTRSKAVSQLISRTRLGFLTKCITIDDLQEIGKSPVVKHKFTMCYRIGTIACR